MTDPPQEDAIIHFTRGAAGLGVRAVPADLGDRAAHDSRK
jgi:hypothetical protein